MNKKVLIVLLFLVLGSSIFILYKSVAPQKSSFEKTTGRETSNSEVSENNNGQTGTGIANPASVYCVQQGGKLEIRKDAEVCGNLPEPSGKTKYSLVTDSA